MTRFENSHTLYIPHYWPCLFLWLTGIWVWSTWNRGLDMCGWPDWRVPQQCQHWVSFGLDLYFCLRHNRCRGIYFHHWILWVLRGRPGERVDVSRGRDRVCFSSNLSEIWRKMKWERERERERERNTEITRHTNTLCSIEILLPILSHIKKSLTI